MFLLFIGPVHLSIFHPWHVCSYIISMCFCIVSFGSWHRGCLSMRASLLIRNGSWAGNFIARCCMGKWCSMHHVYQFLLRGNLLLLRSSLLLHHSYLFLHRVFMFQNDVISCHWLVWVCIRVKCLKACGGYSFTHLVVEVLPWLHLFRII